MPRTGTSRKSDREFLLRVVEALRVSPTKLRRDACGDWRISGRLRKGYAGLQGHISTDSVHWYLYLAPGTARRWESVKRALSFMEVTQDGDTEGVLRAREMPSAEQAATIRKALGLRQSLPMSEAQRSALSSFQFSRDKTPVHSPTSGVADGGRCPTSREAAE